MEPVCVVTALVDLPSGVPGRERRSLEEYLVLAEAVLRLRVPMVVFCDPHLVERIASRRRELASDLPTVVAPYTWHAEAAADTEFLRGAIALGRTASAANEVKDTPEYLAFGWSKPFQLHRATQLMAARQYVWMDIGLAHVAEIPEALSEVLLYDGARLGHPPIHLVTLAHEGWHSNPENMRMTALGAAVGHPGWWRNGAQLVCGGIFGVAAGAVDDLARWVREVILEVYAARMPTTDEMILSRVALLHRSDIRLTDAAYDTLGTRFCESLVPAMADLCPSARIIELPDPAAHDRFALNPSIANDPDGGYCVVIRHANYRYVQGNYVRLDGGDDIITENVFVHLDDEFVVRSVRPIDDSAARIERPLFPVHGLEDMRLFRHGNSWWVSATLREHRSDGLCEIAVCQLDAEARIVSSYIVESPAGARHEKNWAPIEGTERISFLWNVEPPVALGIDRSLGCSTLSRALPQPSECSSARGGSQVVHIPGGYLTVVHHAYALRDRYGERREYRHRLVHYNESGEWRAASREFLFEYAGIEFCAGLARSSDGVVMSYGVEDRAARLVTISWEDVWALLGTGESAA